MAARAVSGGGVEIGPPTSAVPFPSAHSLLDEAPDEGAQLSGHLEMTQGLHRGYIGVTQGLHRDDQNIKANLHIRVSQ